MSEDVERNLFERSATLLMVGTPVISLDGIFIFIFIFILFWEVNLVLVDMPVLDLE